MTLIPRLKLWLSIAGGAGFVILLLLSRVFIMGSQNAKAQNTIAVAKAREKNRERINAATRAGDSVRRQSDRLHDDDGYRRD